MMRSFKRVSGRGRKPMGGNESGCGYNSLGGTRMRRDQSGQRDASSGERRTTSPRQNKGTKGK